MEAFAIKNFIIEINREKTNEISVKSNKLWQIITISSRIK